MAQMIELWLLGVLYGQARRDFKTRRISGWGLLALYAAGALALFFRIGEEGLWAFVSLVPGLLLAGISLLSGQSLGLGDALVLLGMGLYLEGARLWTSLLLGLGLSGVWAALLFIKNRRGGEEIPFLPFLLAGYVGGLAIWHG